MAIRASVFRRARKKNGISNAISYFGQVKIFLTYRDVGKNCGKSGCSKENTKPTALL